MPLRKNRNREMDHLAVNEAIAAVLLNLSSILRAFALICLFTTMCIGVAMDIYFDL